MNLSLHPTVGDSVSELQKEYMEEELADLTPVKEGDVNISGSYLYDDGQQLEVKFFIRNGLNTTINFEYISLMLINSKDEVLAYQEFDLIEMGDIPPFSARPWKVYFDKKNVKVETIPNDDWKIVFDDRLKALENINAEYENLPDSVEDKHKEAMQKFLSELPALKERELNLSTYFVGLDENGNILITLVLRNGINQTVKLDKLPVTVKDNKGRIAVSAVFDADIEIASGKANISNFLIPKELISKEGINFDSLNVDYVFQSDNIAQNES